MLTVKNRTAEPFVGMYDGQSYKIPAGGNLTLTDYVARHLKYQSVYLDNPVTGEKQYKLAIIEEGDDDSPVGQVPIESFDRSDMVEFNKVRHVDSRIKPAAPETRGSGRFENIITKER